MVSRFADNQLAVARMRHNADRIAKDIGEMMRARGSLRGGMGRSSDVPFVTAGANLDETGKNRRQYEAFKDTVFTAIRPIMVKAASQTIRCGFENTSGQKSVATGGFRTKSLTEKESYRDQLRQSGFGCVDDPHDMRQIVESAPLFLRKSIGENVEPLQQHFLMTLLQKPNEYLTGFALKQCSFASMALTGRYVWWFDLNGKPRADVPELGNLRLWYLPMSWLRLPNSGDLQKWQILAPGMGAGHDVTIDELFMSTMNDPGNPLRPYSVLSAQAKAVDTEDKMLRAQAVSMDNAIRPGLIITAGRLPGMPTAGRSGPGQRPLLTGEQRGQIIDAIKTQYQGVARYNEPFIIDALIESITPYLPNPAELDMVNSTGVFQKRIMEGFGVSPTIAGSIGVSNRSESVVAKENFYENTLNPYIEQSSQDMDSVLGRRFSEQGGQRLRVWMELAVADDPDAVLERFKVCMPYMTPDEIREFFNSGKLKLNKLSDKERTELVASADRAALSAAAQRVPEKVVTGQ